MTYCTFALLVSESIAFLGHLVHVLHMIAYLYLVNWDLMQKQDGNHGTKGLGKVCEPAFVLSCINLFIVQTLNRACYTICNSILSLQLAKCYASMVTLHTHQDNIYKHYLEAYNLPNFRRTITKQ